MDLSSPRLLLRPWRDSDRKPFAMMGQDPRVMRYFPAPLTRAQSDALIDRAMEGIRTRGYGFWAVERKDTEAFIGFVGLSVPSYGLPCGPCIEVGWRLHSDHWGQGFATEASRVALRFGFEKIQLEEIVSFTSLVNRASEAVMERLGMVRDAETFMHPKVDPQSELAEHVLYRLSRSTHPGPS